MWFDGVTLALAVLTLAAAVAVAAIVLLAVAAWRSPGLRDRLAPPHQALAPWCLVGAWVVAVIATAGSLYFSESAHLTPCRLCWYQRIAMYPLSLLLLVATLRDDVGVRRYAIPLAAAGALIAAYHYQLERLPSQGAGFCAADIPCSAIQYQRWGFLSIPLMALVAFLLVVALLALARPPAGIHERGADRLAAAPEP